MSWLDRRRNPLTWSHSRSRLYIECPRKYYYRYYAPYGGNAPEETLDRQLVYRLGRLTNIPMLVGSIVHDLARDGLRAARDGHPWADSVYVPSAVKALEKALASSSKAAGTHIRTHGRETTLLDAHFYKEPWGEEQQEAALERARFYAGQLPKHPTFVAACESASDLLSIDRFDRFPVMDVPVYAVPDLMQRLPEGALRLVDWKTGSRVDKHLEVYRDQLAVYALYAQIKWGFAAEKIEAQVAELHTGEAIAVELTAEDLQSTKGRIAASIVEMQSRLRDLERNRAHRDDFEMLAAADTPMEEVPETCRYCPYRLLCYGDRVRA